MQDFVGWQVDNLEFNNKVRAMEHANWDINKVTFHYRENTLDNYDFSKQPDSDWETLLINSCKKLRSSCEHLALWYSGGGDSATILRICAENNIQLDELIFFDRVYGVYDYWQTESEYIRNEMYKFKQQYQPDCKLSFLVVDYNTAINYYRKHGEQWVYQPHTNLRFSKNIRYNVIENNPEFAVEYAKPGRIDIYGRDKPKLILWENRWYLTFLDCFEYDTYVTGHHHFFWDDLDILCKQAHMAVDFFEGLPNFTEEKLHKIQANEPGDIYKQYCTGIGRDIPNDEWIAGGLNKKTNDPNNKLYESRQLLERAKQQDPDIYNMYMKTHQYIDSNFDYGNGSREYIGTLLGKTYYLKDFMQ